MSKPNPFAGEVDALSDDDFALLQQAVETRKCREEIGVGDYDAAARKWRPRPPCPKCCSGECVKAGRTRAGHQRWLCKECGERFAYLDGTIFEGAKKPLSTWALFIRLMYVTDSDLKGPDWKPRRGLSKDKICIAVAIDVHKSVVAVTCGHGKPSSKRIRDALQARIAEGSEIFHDMEKSHKALVRAVKGVDRPYKADTKDPEYLEKMAMVNNLCSWIRRYLRGYVGMDVKNLQPYLDWYAYLFRVKRAEEEWPKVERVVRHLFRADASFRSPRQRLYRHFG